MDPYEAKLNQWLTERKISDFEHLRFSKSCHTVTEAAEAANANPDNFIKSICMKVDEERLIVAIVKGETRASTKRVSKILNAASVRLATPKEILEETGYPVGGTPPLGFDAEFLIDPHVMKKEAVFAGGGSTQSLLFISTQALQQANHGRIARIRK